MGIKFIYAITIIVFLFAIGSMTEFSKWNEIGLHAKAIAVTSFILSFILIIFSILTFLRIGNL